MNARAQILRGQLVQIGDAIAGAFVHLERDPRPDACETLSIRLQGAARHVLSLADEMVRNEPNKESPRA